MTRARRTAPAALQAIAARMPDRLTIRDRLLLTTWERSFLTRQRPVSIVVVHQLLAALIAERQSRFEPRATPLLEEHDR